MSDERHQRTVPGPDLVEYGIDDDPELREAVPLGIQHLSGGPGSHDEGVDRLQERVVRRSRAVGSLGVGIVRL